MSDFFYCKVCTKSLGRWDPYYSPPSDTMCDDCYAKEREKKHNIALIAKLKKQLHTMILRYEPKFCWKCQQRLIPGQNYMSYTDNPMSPYNDVGMEACDKCPPFGSFDD